MNGLINPEIIQQDVTIEVNNIDRQKAEGLISAIEKAKSLF